MSQQNKALARRVIDDIWNAKNPALIDELYDQSFVMQVPDGELRGPKGYHQLYTTYNDAFPDCRLKITDSVSEDDKVVLAYTFTGTHTGELMGVPPSGKSVSVDGTAIMRLSGGKIVEERTIWDTLALMQQIGSVASKEEVGV